MRSYVLTFLCLPILTLPTQAQWDLQDSHTSASLRGIHNVGGGVAWASGTNGTVLRTEDGGYLGQTCATPPGAEHLDFRGIQALDENTAIVMSSGKGDLSRLNKTSDGCKSWKLVFTNPDPDGFWDAFESTPRTAGYPELDRYRKGYVIGDPVNGEFPEFISDYNGEHWQKYLQGTSNTSKAGEALFAASNSSLLRAAQM